MERKYDYIFFNNGTETNLNKLRKEKILHWFKVPNTFVNEFILFTQHHIYWYSECTDHFNNVERVSSTFIAKRNLLYQLKDGCHKLDFKDESLWFCVEDFEKFEIIIGDK